MQVHEKVDGKYACLALSPIKLSPRFMLMGHNGLEEASYGRDEKTTMSWRLTILNESSQMRILQILCGQTMLTRLPSNVIFLDLRISSLKWV